MGFDDDGDDNDDEVPGAIKHDDSRLGPRSASTDSAGEGHSSWVTSGLVGGDEAAVRMPSEDKNVSERSSALSASTSSSSRGEAIVVLIAADRREDRLDARVAADRGMSGAL